jgi:hypothetical protein
MKQLKLKDALSILEAVDFLSSLSEIDVTISSRALGVEEKDTLHPHRWLDGQLIYKNQELVTQSFTSILSYLSDLQENHPDQLQDEHVLKGLQSIFAILDEAAQKIEKFTELFKESPALNSLMDLEEYRKLQEYIASFILPRFSERAESWEEDLLGLKQEDLMGVSKKGLRDIEDIKEDKLYDLFFVKKHDKKPFYDYDMVRRLKLLYDFDQIAETGQEETSFIRIRQLQDKDFHQKAASILAGSSYLIGGFYKEAMKMKGVPLVASMNKALMALMLAANPRSWHSSSTLQESHLFKSSAEYFGDFHFYLRESLHSSEYKKMLSLKSDSTPLLYQHCFTLIHKLCAGYFLSMSLQKEIVSFIRRMIHVGSKMTQVKEPADKFPSLWKELLWEDDSIRQVLQKQPNGPIRCTIESFLKGDIGKGWDPLSHRNVPSHLFTLMSKKKEIAFLRMPAPLMQKSIQVAEVPSEFEQFLKGCLLEDKHEKFLLVNLQDRTSWEEHARSESLENFSKKEDIKQVFSLIGLPKKTDFYFQKEHYHDLDEASLFMDQLIEQFEGREQCGFYWPSSQAKESNVFAKAAVSMVHAVFFDKRKKLTLIERQSFIEIFYFFLILKSIDLYEPDYMALSCKDSIDTGAAASGGFFSFLRMIISDKPWKEEEKDLLLWILYAPALFFRERAIQKTDLNRLVNTMNVFQEGILENRSLLVKECKKLYTDGLPESVEIKKAG